MPDPNPTPNTPAADETVEDAMPQGEARIRAEEELASIPPDTDVHPHFAPEGDPEQSIDEPMHDFIGRSDGA